LGIISEIRGMRIKNLTQIISDKSAVSPLSNVVNINVAKGVFIFRRRIRIG
jgi:hypothetical protein